MPTEGSKRIFLETKKEFFLFLTSTIFLGIIINMIAGVLLNSYQCSINLLLLLLLSFAIIDLLIILPVKKVEYAIECKIIFNLSGKHLVRPVFPYSPFQEDSLFAYQELFKKHPEHEDFFKSPRHDSRVITDFMSLLPILWLSRLSNQFTDDVSGLTYRYPRPPSLHLSKMSKKFEKVITEQEIIDILKKRGNIFAEKEILGYVNRVFLPEEWELQIEDKGITMKRTKIRFLLTHQVQVRVKWDRAHRWIEPPLGVLLNNYEATKDFYTHVFRISFIGESKRSAFFFHGAEDYELYIEELLQHLRNYLDWNLYLEGVKEKLMMNHIKRNFSNDTARSQDVD